MISPLAPASTTGLPPIAATAIDSVYSGTAGSGLPAGRPVARSQTWTPPRQQEETTTSWPFSRVTASALTSLGAFIGGQSSAPRSRSQTRIVFPTPATATGVPSSSLAAAIARTPSARPNGAVSRTSPVAASARYSRRLSQHATVTAPSGPTASARLASSPGAGTAEPGRNPCPGEYSQRRRTGRRWPPP